MKKMENKLLDYCSWNNTAKALRVLQTNKGLNLSEDNGIFFRLAIKQDNTELLSFLLEYYKEHKLICDRETMQYKQALYDLRKILDNAVESFHISSKAKKILTPYIQFEAEASDSDQNLEGFCDPESVSDDYVELCGLESSLVAD